MNAAFSSRFRFPAIRFSRVPAARPAHEFNNALTIIVAHTDLLKLQQPDDVTAKKYLANIMSSVDRMSALTRQMLAYARGGKYYPRRASLNDFVQNALALIRESIDPAVTLATELQDDVIIVEGTLFRTLNGDCAKRSAAID